MLVDLSSNNFAGTVGEWIRKLMNLTYLHLNDNNLMGQILSSVTNNTQLTLLNLKNNYFVGSIPSSVSNLSQLSFLSLANNSFTGSIPSSISNLSQLSTLSLAQQQLPRYRTLNWCFCWSNTKRAFIRVLYVRIRTELVMAHIQLLSMSHFCLVQDWIFFRQYIQVVCVCHVNNDKGTQRNPASICRGYYICSASVCTKGRSSLSVCALCIHTVYTYV